MSYLIVTRHPKHPDRKVFYTGGIGEDCYSNDPERGMRFETEIGARAMADRINRMELYNMIWWVNKISDVPKPHENSLPSKLWETLNSFMEPR